MAKTIFPQTGTVYTDEASGVAANRLDRAFPEPDLKQHAYRNRDKENARYKETLDLEKQRVSQSPEYS